VLIALLVATLCSLLTASIVLMVQGFAARRQEQLVAQQRLVADLARRREAPVTAEEVAGALSLDVQLADRVLRSMVDDVHFTMGIDDDAGCVEFWFLEGADG